MNKNKIKMLALFLTSLPTFAGTMGPITASEKFFLIEGGVAYTHAFYKSSALYPDSVTPITPNGFVINPKNFYPSNFVGGYAGVSFYFPGWLLNSRYNLFESKTKLNTTAGTAIKLAPAKLSFTMDKVFGDINQLSYGAGAGTVIENLNKGQSTITLSPNNPLSESFQGNTQIAPLVEGFVMYRLTNNFGAKFNLEYQIPVNNTFGRGDLNLNLGINYSLPV